MQHQWISSWGCIGTSQWQLSSFINIQPLRVNEWDGVYMCDRMLTGMIQWWWYSGIDIYWLGWWVEGCLLRLWPLPWTSPSPSAKHKQTTILWIRLMSIQCMSILCLLNFIVSFQLYSLQLLILSSCFFTAGWANANCTWLLSTERRQVVTERRQVLAWIPHYYLGHCHYLASFKVSFTLTTHIQLVLKQPHIDPLCECLFRANTELTPEPHADPLRESQLILLVWCLNTALASYSIMLTQGWDTPGGVFINNMPINNRYVCRVIGTCVGW